MSRAGGLRLYAERTCYFRPQEVVIEHSNFALRSPQIRAMFDPRERRYRFAGFSDDDLLSCGGVFH
jgi:hypothetical protein